VAYVDSASGDAETLPAPQAIVDGGAYALRVRGPSMNLRYPDGSYVVVQPWNGGPLPYGKRVIVEREAPDGKIETTVKELIRGAHGEPELWPRSNNPAHQAPIALTDGGSILVRVIGTVIWAMLPE
jgi:phage repressor protein C with HTH and peptisase S24 domain